MTTAALAAPATIADASAAVARHVNLANVRMKLADAEEGSGLPEEAIDLMEQEYRRFLVLHLVHPDVDIVPCKLVDEMWHRHILDTAAYRDDCEALFGRFLDHFPYFGMRGDDDAQALEDAYAHTLELYRSAFGEPAPDTWVTIDASSKCKRTACKPQKCR